MLYIQYVQCDDLGCHENLKILGLNGSVTDLFFSFIVLEESSFFLLSNMLFTN